MVRAPQQPGVGRLKLRTTTSAPTGGADSVTAVSREAGTADGGTAVTITGTGFTGSPSVEFGGAAATSVVVVNSTTITCVTPAHATGVVNVRVGAQTLSSAFEYLPAVTTTFASHDFEDNTLGAFSTNITSGTVAASTDFAQEGTRSCKCNVTGSFAGSGAGLKYSFSGASKNPALSETNGVYFRWFQLVPSATITDISASGHQMKIHLLRQQGGSGQPGHAMLGLGSDFPPGNGTLTVEDDPSTGVAWTVQTGTSFGDGVWRELIVWCKRSGGAGRVRIWIDGVEVLDESDAGVGSDNSALTYDAFFGLVYSESTGALLAYVDKVKICNGFPA